MIINYDFIYDNIYYNGEIHVGSPEQTIHINMRDLINKQVGLEIEDLDE